MAVRNLVSPSLVITRLRFPRSARGALVTGVASGLAERLGVEPFVARLIVMVLALADGVGLLGYLVAWWLSSAPDEAATPEPYSARRTLAVASITLGALLGLRSLGIWPGDAVMFPAIVVATGSGLAAWRRPDPDRSRRLATGVVGALRSGRGSLLRLAVGGLLAIVGIAGLAGVPSIAEVQRTGQPLVFATVGLAIAAGPWLARMVERLDQARRDHIRSEERAALAAHLHDSVLQTLAMIQRSPSDPRRIVRLARRQERELRDWLYGGQAILSGPESVAGAAELLARDVEADHDARIELVTVRDHALDEPARTLLAAVREAVVNAARHSGADTISVYVEAEPDQLTAFVRDRGCGFDVDAVPADRHGISDSIRGRVERAGGRVALNSAPGAGTEVQLTVPLRGTER